MTNQAQQTRTEEIDVRQEPRAPMSAARVRDLFEDAGYGPRRYSGRAMYGDECLAVETDSASGSARVILDVVQACAENGTAGDVIHLVGFLRNSRSDGMGRGTVVYWPDIAWADCGAEEEEEEDHDCEGPHCCSPARGGREDFHSDG